MYLFSFLCKCTSQNNHPNKLRMSLSIQIKLFNLVKILVFSHIAIISENLNIIKCQSFPISCSPSFDVISHLKTFYLNTLKSQSPNHITTNNNLHLQVRIIKMNVSVFK